MSRTGSKQHIGAVALSVMATVIAVFGQNSFLGVFTDDLMSQLDLSFARFGLILMIATLVASVFVQKTGHWMDRLGTVKASLLMTAGGAASLLIFGMVPSLADRFSPLLAILVLGLGMTGFRLFFRGSFRLISSSIVTQAFSERQRGKAVAVSGVLSVVLSAPLPFLAHYFHAAREQGLLIACMLGGLILFGSCALAMRHHLNGPVSKAVVRHDTDDAMPATPLMEARQRADFWLYMLGVPMYSLLLSSVILFLNSVSAHAGVAYAKGLSFYIGAAVIGIPLFVWASMNMKKSRLVFLVYQVSIAVSFAGFLNLGSSLGQFMAFSGFGVASALYSALSMNLWPRLYGRKHANQFFGFAASFDLVATAVGPLLFGLVVDGFSVAWALRIGIMVPLVMSALLVLSHLLPKKDDSVALVMYRGTAR